MHRTILADAPVITNVSVVKTSSPAGQVEVKWMKPFDISAEQYPEPYQYEVFRSGGFHQEGAPVKVSDRILNTTSFVDTTANTIDSVYNYQVVLYSKMKDVDEYNPIDTSSVASTVRLNVTPGEKQITLQWNAEVPWSNVTGERPFHRIYRGLSGDPENALVLIDSVQVSEFGFEYVDRGTFQNDPLREDQYYCYAVETIGSYGNPKIPLLFNKSQMSCSYAVNNLLPCPAQLSVAHTDCGEYLSNLNCEEELFVNELTWTIPSGTGCRSDFVAIKVYLLPR